MNLVWAAVSFCVGSLLTTIPLLAAFASRVAVLEQRANRTERDIGQLISELAEARKDVNGIGAAVRRIPATYRAADD